MKPDSQVQPFKPQILSGARQYLFVDERRVYLDAVNNGTVVGHAQPGRSQAECVEDQTTFGLFPGKRRTTSRCTRQSSASFVILRLFQSSPVA